MNVGEICGYYYAEKRISLTEAQRKIIRNILCGDICKAPRGAGLTTALDAITSYIEHVNDNFKSGRHDGFNTEITAQDLIDAGTYSIEMIKGVYCGKSDEEKQKAINMYGIDANMASKLDLGIETQQKKKSLDARIDEFMWDTAVPLETARGLRAEAVQPQPARQLTRAYGVVNQNTITATHVEHNVEFINRDTEDAVMAANTANNILTRNNNGEEVVTVRNAYGNPIRFVRAERNATVLNPNEDHNDAVDAYRDALTTLARTPF